MKDLTVSLNEVEMLAAKAARGAGAPWGVAEDVARATRWLAAHDLDWAEPLLRLLDDDVIITRIGGAFAVADSLVRAEAGAAWTLDACAPVWTVPILAAALHGRPLALDLTWDGVAVRLRPDGSASADRPWQDHARFGPQRIRVEAGSDEASLPHDLPVSARRGPVKRQAWDQLHVYATRTYVEASAQSRAAGAGGDRVDRD